MKGYWWFRGASVKALADQITTVGAGQARLEVRIDDKESMTFRVVDESADAGKDGVPTDDPINDSHRCPPDCPE